MEGCRGVCQRALLSRPVDTRTRVVGALWMEVHYMATLRHVIQSRALHTVREHADAHDMGFEG